MSRGYVRIAVSGSGVTYPHNFYYEQIERFFEYILKLKDKIYIHETTGGGMFSHFLGDRFHYVFVPYTVERMKKRYDNLYNEFLEEQKHMQQILDKGNHGLELFF